MAIVCGPPGLLCNFLQSTSTSTPLCGEQAQHRKNLPCAATAVNLASQVFDHHGGRLRGCCSSPCAGLLCERYRRSCCRPGAGSPPPPPGSFPSPGTNRSLLDRGSRWLRLSSRSRIRGLVEAMRLEMKVAWAAPPALWANGQPAPVARKSLYRNPHRRSGYMWDPSKPGGAARARNGIAIILQQSAHPASSRRSCWILRHPLVLYSLIEIPMGIIELKSMNRIAHLNRLLQRRMNCRAIMQIPTQSNGVLPIS